MANQVGKRYVCTVCGAEFIVTRGGDGELHCCGKKMEIKKQVTVELLTPFKTRNVEVNGHGTAW